MPSQKRSRVLFHTISSNTLLKSLWANRWLPDLPSPHLLIQCCFRTGHQLNVKWMCTCFRQADRPCSQAWVSLVHPADRHWLKCQGLAVCVASSTGRGLSLRNVRTLNKQQHSSDILYPSVQPDTAWRFDWVRGLHILTDCYSLPSLQ